jgi:hypothetical protein
MAESRLFPQEAVRHLRSLHVPVNLLNEYRFGGYLIWTLAPEYKVFIDGRADLYGDAFLEEYISVYNAERDPDPLLRRWRIRSVILAPDAHLTAVFRVKTRDRSWKLVYEDAQAVIFVREAPG